MLATDACPTSTDSQNIASYWSVVARIKGGAYPLALVRDAGAELEVAFIQNPAYRLDLTRQCRHWVWECSSYEFDPQRFLLEQADLYRVRRWGGSITLASMGRASTALVVRSGCALAAFSGSLLSFLPPRIVELVLTVVLDSILLLAVLTVAVGPVLAASTLWSVARGRGHRARR